VWLTRGSRLTSPVHPRSDRSRRSGSGSIAAYCTARRPSVVTRFSFRIDELAVLEGGARVPESPPRGDHHAFSARQTDRMCSKAVTGNAPPETRSPDGLVRELVEPAVVDRGLQRRGVRSVIHRRAEDNRIGVANLGRQRLGIACILAVRSALKIGRSYSWISSNSVVAPARLAAGGWLRARSECDFRRGDCHRALPRGRRCRSWLSGRPEAGKAARHG